MPVAYASLLVSALMSAANGWIGFRPAFASASAAGMRVP